MDLQWRETKQRLDENDWRAAGKTILRRYVIERDGEKCGDCGIPAFWNGKPLTLDMDHIDGDNKNNSPTKRRCVEQELIAIRDAGEN
jgi:hypothetical protein